MSTYYVVSGDKILPVMPPVVRRNRQRKYPPVGIAKHLGPPSE